MSARLHFGLGDNPLPVDRVWFEECSDGHPRVLYVAGICGPPRGDSEGLRHYHYSGACPACAGASAARFERQEATGA